MGKLKGIGIALLIIGLLVISVLAGSGATST